MVVAHCRIISLIAMCAVLAACWDKGAKPDPAPSFETVTAAAIRAPSQDNIERARELFEALGPQASDAQIVLLDQLAEKTGADWPVETLRLRMLQAAQGRLSAGLANKVASALGSARFDTAATEFIAQNKLVATATEREAIDALKTRLAARDALAKTLALPAPAANAKRLLDILMQSPYASADSRFWAQKPPARAPEAADDGSGEGDEEADGTPTGGRYQNRYARSGGDPLLECENSQFAKAQLIGNAAALAEKYGPENEANYDPEEDEDGDTRVYEDIADALKNAPEPDPIKAKRSARNQTLDRRPVSMLSKVRESEYFLRLEFKPFILPHSGSMLCRASEFTSAQAPQLAYRLAGQAGIEGDFLQGICVGDAAVVLVGTPEMATVVILKADPSGTRLLAAGDLDGGYVRKLKGKGHKDLLMVGNYAGAHGYASGAVYDLQTQTRLFSVNGLLFGHIILLPGSADSGDTVGLQLAVGGGRVPCGQCPQYRKFVALDPSERGYKVSAEVCSIQELPSLSQGVMANNAMVHVLNRDNDLGIGSYEKFASKMLQEKQAPQKIAGSIIANLIEVTDLQQAMADFPSIERRAREALDVLRILPPYDKTTMSQFRHAATLKLMEALIFQSQFERAIALGEAALKDPDIALSATLLADYANRLSIAHLRQGTFRPALKHLQAAIANSRIEDRAPVWGNLAWYSNMAKDYEQGVRYANTAIDGALQHKGRVGVNVRLLAEARFAQGKPGEALDWINFGVSNANARGERTDLLSLQMVAANIAESIGETRLGIVLLEQALVGMDEQTWETEGDEFLLGYARLLNREGKHAEAMALAQRAAGMSGTRSTNILVEANLLVSSEYARQGESVKALAAAKLAFMDSMKVSRSWAGETYQLASAEFARRAADRYFALLLKGGVEPGVAFRELALWKGFILKEGLFPAQAATVNAAIPDPRSLLREHEVYIDYFIGNEAAFAVVVTPGTLRLARLAVRSGDVERLSTSIRQQFDIRDEASRSAIARQRVTPALRQALRELHAQLLQPLVLDGQEKYLMISPDNAVGSIPWSALVTARGDYVGESVATLLVQGAFLLGQPGSCAGQSCGARNLVGLLGNTRATAYLDRDQRTIPLAALTYARREIAGVRSLWPGRIVERSDVLPGNAPVEGATRDWLRREGRRLGVLHLVGHGVFNRQDPLDSQLFVEPGAVDPAHAFITARDISGMDFKGMAVAVISACESGSLGNLGGGEPLGLVRAFLSAGSSQVVASQWLIDDNAALVFTTAFHANLAHDAPVDALFKAQRATARKFSHPYFWAPMQLYGRPYRQPLFLSAQSAQSTQSATDRPVQ